MGVHQSCRKRRCVMHVTTIDPPVIEEKLAHESTVVANLPY